MKKNAKPVKAVIDTNVMVSGLFAESGTIAEVMELWVDGRFELIVSEEILSELHRVLHKPSIKKHFNPTEEEIEEFLEVIRERAVMTPNLYRTDRIKDDPTDNKFLEAAVEGKADFIVSGDRHLTEVKRFMGINIVDVKTFLVRLKKVS